MRLAVSFLVALVVLTVDASADETKPRTYVQTLAPRELCKPDETRPELKICRELPPGRFLDETSWLEMDAKLRELEDTRTNLTAQNKKLRADMAGWQPGFITIAVTLASGFAGGVYAYHKLAKE